MNDSRRTILAWVVRILACLLFLWAVLLLIEPDRPENDFVGYVLLVAAPLVMMTTRWIDPARGRSPEAGEGNGRREADAASGDTGDTPASESPSKSES